MITDLIGLHSFLLPSLMINKWTPALWLANFVNHSYGNGPNWTPLSPITITNCTEIDQMLLSHVQYNYYLWMCSDFYLYLLSCEKKITDTGPMHDILLMTCLDNQIQRINSWQLFTILGTTVMLNFFWKIKVYEQRKKFTHLMEQPWGLLKWGLCKCQSWLVGFC